MNYQTALAKMQKADRTLRVCLGPIKFKRLKSLESKTMKVQQQVMELHTFIKANPEVNTVEELKVVNPEMVVGELSKYFRFDTDTLWQCLNTLQKQCQGAFQEIRKLIQSTAGARDLYQLALKAKTDFTRIHFNIDSQSLEDKMLADVDHMKAIGSLVRQIDAAMAESDYRNQAAITYADYETNIRELFGLDLVLKNYTAENARNFPECEILRPTPIWKYVGVGAEAVEVRIEELQELNARFATVDGVSNLIMDIVELRRNFTEAQEEKKTPRGLTANVLQIDDAGFLPKGNEPESIGKGFNSAVTVAYEYDKLPQQATASEKTYAKGHETPEVELNSGGPIGYVPE